MTGLTRRHVALAAAGFGIFALVGGTELPLASAHHPNATLTGARCLDNGTWGATLAVTANVPGGTATILGATNGTRPVPFSHEYIAVNTDPSMSFDVTVSWPDFTAPTAHLSINRPEGGCGAPATSIPPTTIACAAPPAPPVEGCPFGQPPVTTVPEFAPPTVLIPLPPTTIAVVDSTPPIIHTTDGPTTTVNATPRTVTRALPPTGSASTDIIAIGVAALLVGGAILLAARRWGDA